MCVVCIIYIMTKRTNITLPNELKEYVDKNFINLSKFVQEKLKEYMKEKHESIQVGKMNTL